MDIFEFGDTLYEKVFFHDLRRQEIIAYTEKRLKHSQKKEQIQEKIIQLCKQLELPLNYWTVSLLLLIHNKSSDSYFKNLFSVLDVCIDEIFGKKQLLIAHSRISFEQLKTICAELAKYLFNNFEMDIYSANKQTIITFIDNFISSNDRIATRGIDVFNYLLTCGILKQKDDNDLYVFRLNGFFEYFLALQMTKDTPFKETILNDEVKYLAFKNQIEIYSGFKRDDMDFLSIVYSKSKTKLAPIFNKYSQDKDKELLLKVQEPEKIKDICRNLSIQKTLTTVEKARIEDIGDELQIDADVHHIQEMDTQCVNSELIERYLSILSRVFRNSDEITGNKEKIKELFHYIIDSYCNLGFYIIDEFSSFTQQELKKEAVIDIDEFPELSLLQFISSFSPIIAQVCLFDGLGHFNLERMIKNEIQQLETNLNANQYKLFILYFLLLDIDINANNEFISIAIDKIKIPVLKYMIVLKLNYYLAFKAGSNKKLQQVLSNKIQKAKLGIDNKADIGDIQRKIQERKKLVSINKNQI
jgi:hypothetical protein